MLLHILLLKTLSYSVHASKCVIPYVLSFSQEETPDWAI
jgi:hypothetical protein